MGVGMLKTRLLVVNAELVKALVFCGSGSAHPSALFLLLDLPKLPSSLTI